MAKNIAFSAKNVINISKVACIFLVFPFLNKEHRIQNINLTLIRPALHLSFASSHIYLLIMEMKFVLNLKKKNVTQ